MAEAFFTALTAEKLIDLLQAAGYRAEKFQDSAGDTHLRSATNGVPFNVRLGNRAAAPVEGYFDFTFVTLVKTEGEFPLEGVNTWNAQRRFARLHRAPDFLVLDMDVIVAGGVGEDHIRGIIELWDRMLQELMGFLRANVSGDPTNPANAANVA